MKIKDLIEKLSELPQDADVVIETNSQHYPTTFIKKYSIVISKNSGICEFGLHNEIELLKKEPEAHVTSFYALCP